MGPPRSNVLCCWVTICRAWGKEMLFSTFTLCTSFSRSHTEHFFEEVPWGPAHCAGYTFSTFVAALLWMFSTTAMADSFIFTESSTMAKLWSSTSLVTLMMMMSRHVWWHLSNIGVTTRETNHKQYKCSLCNKCFSQFSNLQSHKGHALATCLL